MKKTTKKLISTFLALVMMLTIIPVGTMTAFAIDVSPASLPTKLAGNDVTWNGDWHATSFDGDVTIYCPSESTNITSNGTIYWGGTTSYPNKVSNLTVGTYNCPCGCNGSFTLGPVPCGKCTACGHAWTKHGSDKCSQCFEDMEGDCYFEIPGSAGACVLDAGHTGACSDTLPPCGLCAACGHPQGSHSEIDDWCNDCKFGDGGKCNGEILFEPCVLPEGHTGGHTAWTTLTDTNEINTLLAKLIGSYKYKYSQNGNTLTIYGDSTNGYKFAYYSNGTETDLTLSVVQQKGNHYYIGFGNIGFTFIFDEEDNLSNIYKAWVKNDGTVNKYYDSEYIYSGPAVCGLCVACGHDKSKHDTRFCEGCNYADGGACEYSDNYVACVLDKGHTGNHSDGTPEWVDTVVAKVDASADKLVDDQGTPFANMLMGGKFADTFIQYKSIEYDNDGSVYTIKGIGNNATGEYIITLDSNEDVASLVTTYYDDGALMFTVTYKKKAPTSGSSSSVVEEEKQEETTPAPAPVTEETSVTKAIVPSKGKIKVTVNKVDGVDGYQIQYGRVKSFKKSKKTITTKKTVKTIKVKKPGKKYYVRVRSFKIVDGKKVYSNWSKIKSIKTK